MVKVSVVIPVFNAEKYIEKCIESILHQTLLDIELILVDDGSTDSSGEKCDAYAQKDQRVRVMHKENGGVSAARNDGFSLVTGEYVIWIDSDDWMEPDACEVLYQEAESQDADIVIADVNRVIGEKIVLKQLFQNPLVYTAREDIEQLIISTLYPRCCRTALSQTGYGGPWNKLIRSEMIRRADLKFNTTVGGLCDDRLFNAAAYTYANRISYIQKVVYNYVEVGGSVTKSYKSDIRNINRNIFSAYEQIINTFYRRLNSKASKEPGEIEWSRDMRNAYGCFVMWRLDDAVRLYFYNVKNNNSSTEKDEELRNLMHEEPYASAAQNVDIDYLHTFTKSLAKGVKKDSVFYIKMQFQLYNLAKRLLKK